MCFSPVSALGACSKLLFVVVAPFVAVVAVAICHFHICHLPLVVVVAVVVVSNEFSIVSAVL